MTDINNTNKFISIDLLNKILFDENYFNNFINRKDDFANIDNDINTYIDSLNTYMDNIVNINRVIDINVFRRINAINSIYGMKKEYNYINYLSSKGNNSNAIAIDLLTNSVDYDKFMNFYDNTNYFQNNISYYLEQITKYRNLCNTNFNFFFNEDMNTRFNCIMAKYSLELKRKHSLSGYKPNGIVDKSIIDEVVGNKYNNIENMNTFDKFAMCRDIYIKLCKLCEYDSYFSFYQKKNNPIADEIYNKDIKDIKSDNPTVICKTFSEIYAVILNSLGINATVVGGYHKYVQFDVDGTLMKADGTQTLENNVASNNMNDMTAVKFGFPTVGFKCLEDDKIIDYYINEADKKNNYIKETEEAKLKSSIDEYNRLYTDPNEYISLDDRISMLYNISELARQNSDSLTLVQYYKMLIDNEFRKEIESNLVDVRYAFNETAKGEGQFSILMSITNEVSNDNSFEYYLFSRNGVNNVPEDIVRELVVDSKSLKILSSNGLIHGLEKYKNNGECENGRSK